MRLLLDDCVPRLLKRLSPSSRLYVAIRPMPDTTYGFCRRVMAMFCGAANGYSKTREPQAERRRRPAHTDSHGPAEPEDRLHLGFRKLPLTSIKK